MFTYMNLRVYMTHPIFDPETARLMAAQFKFSAPRPIARVLETVRGVSRQAAAAQVRRWVQAGLLEEEGNTRPKRFRLSVFERFEQCFPLDGFDEHVVWSTTLRPVVAQYASDAAMKIWDYGATEMLNNAKDHSQGTCVRVRIGITGAYATLIISDDGEGIFKRIARLCELPDERLSILELAKGKLTTDRTRHSGEGIFFTSRAVDQYQIQSGDLIFDHTDHHDDTFIDAQDHNPGTTVVLRLCHTTERTMRSVFDEYTTEDDDEGLSRFNRTVIPVRLARLGTESVVSRSQAQRLLARIDQFQAVILDFDQVDSIGQGFADEIFRVFKQQHPEVDIKVWNASDDVQYMIRRVRGS